MAKKSSLILGEDYCDSSHGHSPGCVNSDCGRARVMLFEVGLVEMAKGVRKVPKLSGVETRMEYALMCECPECGEHYRFHINRLVARTVKNRVDLCV